MKRTLLGIAVSLCACAIAAEPALAGKVFKAEAAHKEYTEAEPGKSHGRGLEGEMQEFHFAPFKIQCELATAHSLVTAKESKTYYTIVRYSKCTTEGKIGAQTIHLATEFKTPIDYEYHANGFAETGAESESEMRLVTPGEILVKVPSIKCIIHVPAQTIPVAAIKNPEGEFSAVTYENEEVEKLSKEGKILPAFPTGFQKQLVIHNELKRIEYFLEGGQCENFTVTGGKVGTYLGSLKEWITGGNLSIGEENEVV